MNISTQIDAEAIMIEAINAANAAGEDKLRQLMGEGPQFDVRNGERVVGHMLDVCGGAWVKIQDGRSPLISALKKIGVKDGSGSYKAQDYSWWISKAHGTGYNLNIRTQINRQEMSVNVAIANAVVTVLAIHGFSSGVHSYVD